MNSEDRTQLIEAARAVCGDFGLREEWCSAGGVGALLVSVGWKHEGMLPKVLTVAEILAFIEALYLLKAKSADLIVAWLVRLPVIYFRIFAVCQIMVGAMIIWGLER